MAIGTVQVGAPVNLSASGIVAGGTAMARTHVDSLDARQTQAENTSIEGAILGFFANTAGTLQLFTNNNGAAGTALTGSIVIPAVGWYSLPISSVGGIWVTITSGNYTFAVVK